MHLPVQAYIALLLLVTVSANSIRGWPRYEPNSDLARYGLSLDAGISSVAATVNPTLILFISFLTVLADSFNNLGQIGASITPSLRSRLPCESKHADLAEEKNSEHGGVGAMGEELKVV